MGVLGTVIYGVALRERSRAIENLGQPARLMSAIDIPAVADSFIRALRMLGVQLNSTQVCMERCMSEADSHDGNRTADRDSHVEGLERRIAEARRTPVRILMVGKTGAGKSSTINRLLGKSIAPTGAFEATTRKVIAYKSDTVSIAGFDFEVIDTPGLCDDLPSRGNDAAYLAAMKKKVRRIDLALYVARLPETRITADEKTAIRKITKAFGRKIWNHGLVVFTHARQVADDLERWRSERSRLFLSEIKSIAPNADITREHCVCLDNEEDIDAEGYGLAELWLQALLRIDSNGFIQFLIAQAPRVRRSSKSEGTSSSPFEYSKFAYDHLLKKDKNSDWYKRSDWLSDLLKTSTTREQPSFEFKFDPVPASSSSRSLDARLTAPQSFHTDVCLPTTSTTRELSETKSKVKTRRVKPKEDSPVVKPVVVADIGARSQTSVESIVLTPSQESKVVSRASKELKGLFAGIGAGATLGAGVGTLFGPVGTATGTMVGAAIGAIAAYVYNKLSSD